MHEWKIPDSSLHFLWEWRCGWEWNTWEGKGGVGWRFGERLTSWSCFQWIRLSVIQEWMISDNALHYSQVFHQCLELKCIWSCAYILGLHIITDISQVDLLAGFTSLVQDHVDVNVTEWTGRTARLESRWLLVSLWAMDVVVVGVTEWNHKYITVF